MFGFRETTEHDVTYIKRLNYLAEVFGDESTTPDAEGFRAANAFYTGAWDPADGIIVMDESLDVPAGGCWFIFGDAELHGTGFVEEDVPELAIAVESRYQGNKLGPALVERVSELVRERGCPGVSLCVHADNPRAKKVYERLGFVEVGEREGGYLAMMKRWGGPRTSISDCRC